MTRSPLLQIQVIFLTLIVIPLTTFAATGSFDRANFLKDPFLPFYSYDNSAEMLADFNSRFSETYELLNDEELNLKVQVLVDEVYLGFKKLYPKFMSNKSKPPFVVAKSDDGMDLTAYMPRQHDNAHKGLMIFTTGFINSPTSKDVKLGLVAHEMSHLFFWHLDSNTNPVRVYYANGKPITETEVDVFMSWFLMADIMGWVSQKEMNGLTIDSQIGSGVSDLITKLINIESEKCGGSLYNDLMGPMIKLRTEYMDRLRWGYYPKDEERSKIDYETRAVIDRINTCLVTQPATTNKIELSSYVKRVLRYSGVEHDYLSSKSGEAWMSAIEDMVSTKTMTFFEYIDLAQKAQAKMVASRVWWKKKIGDPYR